MSGSPAIPEWEEMGIPVDDSAEPEDAGVDHNLETEHKDK